MSRAILIMGESGAGKTTSLRNLDPKEVFYIDCDGKGLSWKGWRNQYAADKKNYYATADKDEVHKAMKGISASRPDIKYIVIDTLNAIMIADEMKRVNERGYDKWVDLAQCIFNIVTDASRLREDLTVVCLAHTQTDVDEATGERFTRMLTNGKKLNKIGVEKYFTTVLLCKRADNGEFIYETVSKKSTAKTPLGAFDKEEIPNDFAEVMKTLCEY